jgi:hypothetical protein
LVDDDDRSRSEYYSHCVTTDRWPESANKDSENDIEGPGLDSEHVDDSDAIHELLIDIDIDSHKGQVDTWSGGISGGISKTTTLDPDHKESFHFFPNNQQVSRIKLTNRLISAEHASAGYPYWRCARQY